MQSNATLVIIPAFNEEANLPRVLEAIGDVVSDVEVVVIDDGSSDATAQVATAFGATVLRHPFNLGYGAALQTGYKYAKRADAGWVVQLDSDAQHDPRDIPKLLAPVQEGACDLAIGSRFVSPTGYEMGAAKSLGRRLFQAVARLFRLRITDPTSGFQAMNRAVLDLYVTDFFPADYPDVNVLLAAHRAGLRIREYAVEMSAGERPSMLHVGLKPIYYVYKMLLSTWAASARRRTR
jgi:glycosyltransferase involved in cell wall biosynthesis